MAANEELTSFPTHSKKVVRLKDATSKIPASVSVEEITQWLDTEIEAQFQEAAASFTEEQHKSALQAGLQIATTSAMKRMEQLIEREVAAAVAEAECRATAAKEAAVVHAVKEADQRWSSVQHIESERRIAVTQAVKKTEARCAEEKLIAVQDAVAAVKLQFGKNQEIVAAEVVKETFSSATASIASALAAAQSLQDGRSSARSGRTQDLTHF